MLTERVAKENVRFSRLFWTVGTPSQVVFTASESEHERDVNFPLMLFDANDLCV